MFDLIKEPIVEAPPDGQGGPRWLVNLSDGRTVVGRPSWMTSGGGVALPNELVGTSSESDWRRLMRLCQDERLRVVKIGLWVPPWGMVTIADEGAPAYGYFENQVGELNTTNPQRGISSLVICWPERKGKGWVVQHRYVFADGRYEGWVAPGAWLPCMIGDREHDLVDRNDTTGRPDLVNDLTKGR